MNEPQKLSDTEIWREFDACARQAERIAPTPAPAPMPAPIAAPRPAPPTPPTVAQRLAAAGEVVKILLLIAIQLAKLAMVSVWMVILAMIFWALI